MLAPAQLLQQQGYRVAFACLECARQRVEAAQLRFISLGPSPPAEEELLLLQQAMDPEADPKAASQAAMKHFLGGSCWCTVCYQIWWQAAVTPGGLARCSKMPPPPTSVPVSTGHVHPPHPPPGLADSHTHAAAGAEGPHAAHVIVGHTIPAYTLLPGQEMQLQRDL